jgi:hypothetical protein
VNSLDGEQCNHIVVVVLSFVHNGPGLKSKNARKPCSKQFIRLIKSLLICCARETYPELVRNIRRTAIFFRSGMGITSI